MTDQDAITKTDRIKDRLRACKTVAEVNDTVKAVAPEVADLAALDPVGVTHIKKLAAYRRMCISRGWG